MLAHFLFALDLSGWTVQAAGIAAAGLVLMVGRFLTARRHGRTAPAPTEPVAAPQPSPSAGDVVWHRRQSEPHLYRVPADVTKKVEETWK
jgi:hypothetical protein